MNPLRTWQREPRVNAWVIIGTSLLLIAHKPWALTTPQLWAEDGSIFLTQNDQWGARAIFTPFQGYLHLIPRLIAWTASHSVDPALWPLFYNTSAAVITLLLLVRFASSRLDLPGKPWLILTFGFVVHTGEVYFNITNLQWLTAFFLVQQAFIARPVTWRERGSDIALTLVVGLTGPFTVLLLPLFGWRWWRARHRDNLVLLLAIAACAVTQAWFIWKNSDAISEPVAPLHPPMLVAVLSSRLIFWPLFGSRIAEMLPIAALALLGGALFLGFAAWTLRAHPRRELRAQILGVVVVLALAGAWRSRADTWETTNLANGDRYFFIPRLLLLWLLIWEIDAAQRAAAWLARGLCLLGALLELPQHRVPAPPDYHWAERCEPIRRGVPANIPTLPEGWTLEYAGRPSGRAH